MKTHLINQIVEAVIVGPLRPDIVRERLVAMALAKNLHWRDLVLAADEVERRTGLQIHPVPSTPPGQ